MELNENNIYPCGECSKEVFKHPSKVKDSKSGKVFCSRSCAAKYLRRQEKEQGKRTVKKCTTCTCPQCNGEKKWSSKLCRTCYYKNKRGGYSTIGERPINSLNKDSNLRAASIRHHSRAVALEFLKKECKICNFNRYTEVCHIKPLKDFEETSTLNEVNAVANLAILCPNHHKLLDNNLLSKEELALLHK